MREGGIGFGGDGNVSRYAFPGDPVTGEFWSEVNSDGEGGSNYTLSRDVRFAFSAGPFTMQPEEVRDIYLATVYSQGSDRFSSISQLRKDVDSLRMEHETGAIEAYPLSTSDSERPFRSLHLSNYPNPVSSSTVISYELPTTAHVQLVVFDVLGRKVSQLADEFQPRGHNQVQWNAGSLAPGVYFYQISVGSRASTGTMLVVP